jgi:hypothetical protein
MNITGKIKAIGEVKTFAKGFLKRDIIVTTDDKYPQHIKFEIVKEDAQLFNHKLGDIVDVHFNVKGNEWKGNYYVSLQAWKITAKRLDIVNEVVNSNEEELPF